MVVLVARIIFTNTLKGKECGRLHDGYLTKIITLQQNFFGLFFEVWIIFTNTLGFNYLVSTIFTITLRCGGGGLLLWVVLEWFSQKFCVSVIVVKMNQTLSRGWGGVICWALCENVFHNEGPRNWRSVNLKLYEMKHNPVNRLSLYLS